MIEYQYKVVMIPQRRNQQFHPVFDGTRKECKNFLEKIDAVERKKYFLGQYYENSLNKVYYGDKEMVIDELTKSQEKPVVERDNTNRIPVQHIEKYKESDKRSLEILKEKYK